MAKDFNSENFDVDNIIKMVNPLLRDQFKITDEKRSQIIQLIEFFIKASKIEGNRDPELGMAKDLVKIAKRDLKAYKILLDADDIANAIYHLQQASEKIIKAYGLAHHMTDINQLKTISHNSPRVFIDMVEKRWIKDYLGTLNGFGMNLNTDYKGLIDVVKNSQNKERIGRYSEREIEELLSLKNKINKATIDSLKQVFVEDADISDMEELVVETPSRFIEAYLIAVITYPHAFFAKYPDESMNAEDYNREMGIVKKSDDISQRLIKLADYLDDYIIEDDQETQI